MRNALDFNMNKFNEEMYSFFSSYVDVENEETKRLSKELELLKIKNNSLKLEIAKLKGENKNLKENPNNKKYPIKNLRNKIEEMYDFLSKESKEILISTEYIFLNENEDIDYSGVYIGYIKLLEIELRGKLSINENLTFGNLIEKIEQTRMFNGLIQELGKNRVIDNRNRGAHRGIIKKIECGRLRKVLIEEGWLRRIVEYFQSIDFSNKEIEEVIWGD